MDILKTLVQLQVNTATPERAQELGQLGYMQWLSNLRPEANYNAAAAYAFLQAAPLMGAHPAVAAYCDLLRRSLDGPAVLLDLSMPKPQRRGGAQERRLSY